MSTRPRVVIVGAGIAGLSTARAIRAEAPDAEIVVLEASSRAGGNIRTESIDGYVCEAGPDGFLDNAPATLEFVADVGLTPALLPSRDAARRRFIFRHGRLNEVPLSPFAFLRTPLLSAASKMRVACEPFTRHAPPHDESILHFAERHIGHEAAHVLVGSMVSGIFAGDAAELSLHSCFPRMHDMDAHYRSLVRAVIAKRREHGSANGVGAPAGRLTSFASGMQSLIDAAVESIEDVVRTSRKVWELRPRRLRESGPRLVGARSFTVISDGRPIEADAVILAGPASESADLVRAFDPEAARQLNGIATAPIAVVCLGYDQRALTADRGPLDGFGFLVPRGEGPRILGALWESSIYPGRAPAGKALLRVMVGGATDREAANLDESHLVAVVRDDLHRTMGVRVLPEFVHVFRHRGGIPQYAIGHGARLARIDARFRDYPGLFLAGNSYRGVSINACIEDAPLVAHRVATHLQEVSSRLEYAVAH